MVNPIKVNMVSCVITTEYVDRYIKVCMHTYLILRLLYCEYGVLEYENSTNENVCTYSVFSTVNGLDASV